MYGPQATNDDEMVGRALDLDVDGLIDVDELNTSFNPVDNPAEALKELIQRRKW